MEKIEEANSAEELAKSGSSDWEYRDDYDIFAINREFFLFCSEAEAL